MTEQQDPRRTIRKLNLMGLAITVFLVGGVGGWAATTQLGRRGDRARHDRGRVERQEGAASDRRRGRRDPRQGGRRGRSRPDRAAARRYRDQGHARRGALPARRAHGAGGAAAGRARRRRCHRVPGAADERPRGGIGHDGGGRRGEAVRVATERAHRPARAIARAGRADERGDPRPVGAAGGQGEPSSS